MMEPITTAIVMFRVWCFMLWWWTGCL